MAGSACSVRPHQSLDDSTGNAWQRGSTASDLVSGPAPLSGLSQPFSRARAFRATRGRWRPHDVWGCQLFGGHDRNRTPGGRILGRRLGRAIRPVDGGPHAHGPGRQHNLAHFRAVAVQGRGPPWRLCVRTHLADLSAAACATPSGTDAGTPPTRCRNVRLLPGTSRAERSRLGRCAVSFQRANSVRRSCGRTSSNSTPASPAARAGSRRRWWRC